MFEPTEHRVDDDIRKSMELFERAKVGDVAPIEPRNPQRLLVVLDGSSQDATSVSVAQGLRKRFRIPVMVMDGREFVETNELAERMATSWDAEAIDKQNGDSYDQILMGIAQSECDLVIVPCPFGRDLKTIGADSTGTVIDVLLSRSPVPVLVIRHPCPDHHNPFAHVCMALLGENEAADAAATWATGLVTSTGRVDLALILTHEAFQNVRQLLQSLVPDTEITPERISDSLARSQLRLHRALQKTATEAGFKYRLDVLRDDDGSPDETAGSDTSMVLVLPLERRDHRSQGYVHHRIRQASGPLLVVPTAAVPTTGDS